MPFPMSLLSTLLDISEILFIFHEVRLIQNRFSVIVCRNMKRMKGIEMLV